MADKVTNASVVEVLFGTLTNTIRIPHIKPQIRGSVMQAWILLDIALTETIYPLRFLHFKLLSSSQKLVKVTNGRGRHQVLVLVPALKFQNMRPLLAITVSSGQLATWQEVGKCHNFRAISPTARTRTQHTVTDWPAGKGCGKMLPGKKWTEGHTSIFTQATREQNSFSWTRHLSTRAIKIWWKSQSTIVEEK